MENSLARTFFKVLFIRKARQRLRHRVYPGYEQPALTVPYPRHDAVSAKVR